MTYYAVYKGDSLIAHGTIEEIAKQTGKRLEYVTPSAIKRQSGDNNRQKFIKVEEN